MKAQQFKPLRGVLFAFSITLGCNAQASDLMEIYELAKANDAVLAAQQHLYLADQTLLDQSRSAFKPQLDVGANAGLQRDDIKTDTLDANDTYGTAGADIGLTQQIYNRANRINIDQAEQAVKRSEILLRGAEQDLVVRAATSYFSVLASEDNFDLAVSEKRANARQLELAKERLNVGLGTTTDLYDAQARFKLSEASEIEARNGINQAQLSLAELIGQLPGNLERLALDRELDAPQPSNIEHWAKSALEGNLDILAQQHGVEIARQEIDLQQAGNNATIGFNLSHRYAYYDGGIPRGADRTNNNTVALLQLRIPFYQGGLTRARTQEASERFHANEQQLESIERSANSQARQSYRDIISTISRVNALKQAVEASESALNAKEEGFKAGINTNIQVLDAQRDLFRAKRDHLSARYEYILNSLLLQLAIGALDEDDLKIYNEWLI